jgi:N-acetylmuramic acid 6-phosphate etherase
MSGSRDHFETERPNPASERLDELPVAEAFDVMNAEDARVAAAVAAAKPEIVRAIELVVDRLSRGGRLLYFGAGTSGRLGVLDAAECPPTFQSDPSQVQGVIAGGEGALTSAVEGAEDSRDSGARDVDSRGVGALDVAFGIAAGGTTPYVHGALARARELGAATVFLACVPREQARDEADVSIRVVTGPEVLSGSTRLKAGTATKLVLNSVTTLAMARLGKVHGNLMVDVETRANAKLWQRGIALVQRIVGCDRARAEELLGAAGGRVKVAAVMGCTRVDADAARARLERTRGFLRRALSAAERRHQDQSPYD